MAHDEAREGGTYRAAGVIRLSLLLLGLLCVARGRAHAYSSFGDYIAPIEEGGGGGKLFTGTPADGYTCDVCHRGAEPSTLQIGGLPQGGYVPGQTYEITFQWPDAPLHVSEAPGGGEAITAPRVALMAEFTDLAGTPAGTAALVPYVMWLESERCADGASPAADLCRVGEAPACCSEAAPDPNGCSFPGERSVLWMLECGARAARVRWTAPAQPVDVWFSASMLTSNAGNDVDGDGVTLRRQRLHAAGASDVRTQAFGSCQVQALASPRAPNAGGYVLLLVLSSLGLWARRRRRQQIGVRSHPLPSMFAEAQVARSVAGYRARQNT